VALATRGGYILANILRAIGLFIVAVLVLYIVLVVLGANPANAFYGFVAYLANLFNLGLSDLFLPPDERLRVALNYGVAAVIWLLVTMVVTRLARRL
jgi:hypothetical protein